MKEKIHILCKPEDRETVAEMARRVQEKSGMPIVVVTDKKDVPEGCDAMYLGADESAPMDIATQDDFHLWHATQKVDDTIYRDTKTRKAKEMKDRKWQHRMAVRYSNKHYRK